MTLLVIPFLLNQKGEFDQLIKLLFCDKCMVTCSGRVSLDWLRLNSFRLRFFSDSVPPTTPSLPQLRPFHDFVSSTTFSLPQLRPFQDFVAGP